MDGSLSRSQSPNPFPLKRTGEHVEGEVIDKQAAEGSSVAYNISVKFSTELEKKAREVPLTAADAETAKRNPAAVRYLQFQEALRKGDKEEIRSFAPPEARAQLDGPDFPQMLKLL